MKVLVTGSAGFLGSHLAEALLRVGHEVVGIDDLSGGSMENVQAIPQHLFVDADILDASDMQYVAEHLAGCDAVYHCAAMAYEGLSVFSPACISQNILVGTMSVAVAAIKAGVKRFVNCSSMARYGVPLYPDSREPVESGETFSESYIPRPVDPYGVAKLAAEQSLNILGAEHGMRVVHAVPHNIIGARQNFRDPFRNVAAIMANRILQGKPPLIYGDGEQTRCFSHVGDVVPTMLAMLVENGPHGDVYNVGPDGDAVTINELAATLLDITKSDLKPEHLPPRPCEVKTALCSSDKIRRVFGFEQKTPLRAALEEVVAYVRKYGPQPFKYNLPLEITTERTPRTWRDRLL